MKPILYFGGGLLLLTLVSMFAPELVNSMTTLSAFTFLAYLAINEIR